MREVKMYIYDENENEIDNFTEGVKVITLESEDDKCVQQIVLTDLKGEVIYIPKFQDNQTQ